VNRPVGRSGIFIAEPCAEPQEGVFGIHIIVGYFFDHSGWNAS